MVTPKALTILAGGAVAVTAGTGAAIWATSTEGTVTSDAAVQAQLDCERIAEELQASLEGAEAHPDTPSATAEGEATFFVAFDDTDLIDPQWRHDEMTVSGRWSVEDLSADADVRATTLTGDELTFSTSAAGDVVIDDESTVVCGDIQTEAALMHVTATDEDLQRIRDAVDGRPTLDDGLIPGDEGPTIDPTDPEVDEDVTVDDVGEAEAEAEADVDARDGDADAEAEADAEAGNDDADAEADAEADVESGADDVEPTTEPTEPTDEDVEPTDDI